ncbi:hypothetical protein [Salibacterium aidingense]|uniref:hypothetical protein n=1 Tax=Salibacterium aidingense TaxID=384933 RepID=UPI000425F433|nr:hypothetical protein [Salibacterium aidingense]
MEKVFWKNEKCDLEIVKGAYPNGQTAILLTTETGERMATATVALNVPIKENEVLIKSYSENSGMIEALMQADVVEPPKDVVPCGMATAFLCELKG